MRISMNLLHLLLSALAVAAAGCPSHMHSPSDQALAKKAREQADGLSESLTGMFASMKANLEAVSALESKLYKTQSTTEAQTLARQVTRMTWSELREQLGTAGPMGDLNEKLTQIASKINEELVYLREKTPREKAQLETAQQELNAARRALTNWNKRLAVLEKIIELTPSVEAASSEIKESDDFRTAINGAFRTVWDDLDAATFSYIDANGVEVTDARLVTETTKLLDEPTVTNLAKSDPEADAVLDIVQAVVTPESPALLVTVAALAQDLAEAERARTLAHIHSLESRKESADRARRLIAVAQNLAKEAAQAIPIAEFPDEEQVLDTLTRLASPKKGADESEETFEARKNETLALLKQGTLAVQHYVMVAGPITARVSDAERDIAYLKHLHSIEISEINARQHEALVSAGAEGLATYHEGGLKPTEVAEIVYQIAQLSILGVIAERVD